MKALIFAAGLGERMRPLTTNTPKPLLRAGGRRLIEWHLERLAAAGVTDVGVNISWLAPQFAPARGDGSRWGLRLHLLDEGPIPLETGGGILNALPLLGDAPFIVVNGDVWCDLDFAHLPPQLHGDAHLVLVDNPVQHPDGDFLLRDDGRVEDTANGPRLTYAGIAVYHPRIVAHWQAVIGDAPGSEAMPPRFRLAPLLRAAMQRCAVTGQHYRGDWVDVGTPQRLAELDARLAR